MAKVEESKRLSFCVVSCNRLWQLEHTLRHNLEVIDPSTTEIVLVDYGSSDEISSYIWNNFSDAVYAGALRFFEVINPGTYHCPRAKNLAHRIACGSYLFNLDADNFVTQDDYLSILSAAEKGLSVWQFSGDLNDGSYGRIGLSRDLFFSIGGYDETLLPITVQDTDLLNRIDLEVGDNKILLPPTKRRAIKNNSDQKIQSIQNHSNVESDKFLINMCELNLALIRFKREYFGKKIEQNFATYQGYLNGQKILIDGFSQIHKLD